MKCLLPVPGLASLLKNFCCDELVANYRFFRSCRAEPGVSPAGSLCSRTIHGPRLVGARAQGYNTTGPLVLQMGASPAVTLDLQTADR